MFDTTEFATEWTADLHDPSERLPPLVVNGSVYAGTRDDVIAFDASDGTRRREFGLQESIVAGPAFGDGLVHVGTHARDNATVYALDPDGFSAWDLTTDASSISAICTGNGLTYVAADRRVYGVRDGTVEWEVNTRTRERSKKEITAMAYADGTLIVTVQGRTVLGLDGTDGTRHWQTGLEFAPTILTVSDGLAALGDPEDYVVLCVLDTASGEIQWQTQLFEPLCTDPVVADEAIYAAQYHGSSDDGKLVALDRSDGSELWSPRHAGTNLIVGMVAVEETLYAAYVSGRIVARDTFDGERRADVEFDGEVVQSMIGHDSHLYLTAHSSSSGTGQLIAISTPHERMGESPVTGPASEDEPAVDATTEATCPSCGEPMDGDEAFCPGCGEDLSSAGPTCPGCDADLEGDEAFCPECGHALSE